MSRLWSSVCQVSVSLNLLFHFSNEEWETSQWLKCQQFLQLTGNWSVAWPFSVGANIPVAFCSDQRCPLHSSSIAGIVMAGEEWWCLLSCGNCDHLQRKSSDVLLEQLLLGRLDMEFSPKNQEACFKGRDCSLSSAVKTVTYFRVKGWWKL